MQRVQAQAVTLTARHAFALRRDVLLPRGQYTGTETRIGVETRGGNVSWTLPRYTIDFTADQLASLGAKVAPNLIDAKIDVTTFVRSGKLTVA